MRTSDTLLVELADELQRPFGRGQRVRFASLEWPFLNGEEATFEIRRSWWQRLRKEPLVISGFWLTVPDGQRHYIQFDSGASIRASHGNRIVIRPRIRAEGP